MQTETTLQESPLAKHRYRIGLFILVGNILAILLIFLFFILDGYTDEEATQLLKFLAPIKALYITTIIKFVISDKNKSTENAQNDAKEIEVLPRLYAPLTTIIVYGHLISINLLITLCAFNIGMSFEDLLLFLSIIETSFGIYVGLIISDLFQAEKEKNNEN